MSTIHAEVDPLTRDFGLVPDTKKATVETILRRFMRGIGELVESAEAKALQNHGEACHQSCSGCGLSLETHMLPAEFLPTAYGLLWAIVDSKLFVCHGNQPEWKGARNVIDTSRLRLCGNWVTIMQLHDDAISSLAKRTMSEITAILGPRRTV